MPPFFTRHLILVNYAFLSQFSQPMSILFSYLKTVRHNSVIDLFCDQEQLLFFMVSFKKNSLFAMFF